MKMKRGLALLMALCMLIGMMPMVGVSAEEYPAITLDAEQTVTISGEGEIAYFAFTPAYTESYMFYSLGDSDTYGYIYDSEMNQLAYNDDGENINFSVTYDLEAGKTYILGARFYSSIETGDFSVMLKANHTSSTDGEMVKEPSCTEQGSMNCVCDVCGETYTQAIPTVPHTWDANNTCTVCQYAIPALLTDTETTVIISEGDAIAFFSYTPAYTHEYEFYAISDSDTYGSVYDMDMNELDYDDDSGDEMNFLICYTLEAGKTYILGAKYLSDEEIGTFQVVLKANHSCSTEGVVTKEPTCTEDGEMICICDVCGDEYTEVIPGGHTWGVDEMVCDRCGVEFHEEGTCGDDVTWVLDKTGTLTISGTGQMYDWSSSGAPWYDYQEMIKIVVLEDGVSSIGDYAFDDCSSLNYIIFNGDAPVISDTAFWDVTTNAYYPVNNPTWTEDVMQNYGGNITWVAMSDAFVAEGVCGDNLTWTLDNDGVLIISGTGPMYDYNNNDCIPEWADYMVEKVILPNGITTIGDFAFSTCGSLSECIIPDSVTNIGEYAFAYTDLERMIIPGSVKMVEKCAFSMCDRLTQLTLSEGVESIGEFAFEYCTGLSEMVLPATLRDFDGTTVMSCDALETIEVDENNPYFICVNKAVYTTDGTTLVWADPSFSGEYSIPETVKIIGPGAFYDRDEITNILFHANVTEIGDYALAYCHGLQEIILPEGITKVGDRAFYSNSATVISIPSTLDEVGRLAFCNSNKLENLYIADLVSWCQIDFGSHLTSSITNPIAYAEHLYIGGKETTKIMIPDSINRIETCAFYGARMITDVVIPSNVTEIGGGAFGNMEEITVVFEGDAPTFEEDRPGWAPSSVVGAFYCSDVIAYYPAGNATWTVDVMQDYTGDITWVAQYEMLDGDGSIVQMSGTPELEIRAAGEISEFEGVTVDGELVDPSNYTVTEGSTIVTFKPEYLKTLEEGDHTIEVHFTDGVAIAEISVEKPAGILGDLDLNGLVNSDDLTLLARHVGGIELVDGQALLNADVNGDGKVNSDDLTKHARYVGGIITDWDQD